MAYNMRPEAPQEPARAASGPVAPGIRTPTPGAALQDDDRRYAVGDDVIAALEQRLGPIVLKLENKAGDVDLRRLTGDEAMVYFRTMGIPIGGRI